MEVEKEITIPLLPYERSSGNHSNLVTISMNKKLERFVKKTRKTKTCWLWQGTKDREGYGYFKNCNHLITVHRFSYMLHFGRIPKGLDVLHKCDIRNCVNPQHLFLGTQRDNNIDRNNKGRDNSPKGEQHSMSKLTEEQVREIRRLRALGLKYKDIAALFGVTKTNIFCVATRKTWRWLK